MYSKPTVYTYLGKIGKNEYLFSLSTPNKPIQFDVYNSAKHLDIYCYQNQIDSILQANAYIKCARPYRAYLLNINKYNFKVKNRKRKLLRYLKTGGFVNLSR